MSTTITAKDVAALRARTGAGMMDCKKALEETGGDVERAVDLLRQKGIARAAKRADRGATEGAHAAEVARLREAAHVLAHASGMLRDRPE